MARAREQLELRGFHHGATETTEITEKSLTSKFFSAFLAVKDFPVL